MHELSEEPRHKRIASSHSKRVVLDQSIHAAIVTGCGYPSRSFPPPKRFLGPDMPVALAWV